jgi:hypothetical protein
MTQDLIQSPGDLGALIRNLGSRQPSVRAEAELTLKNLTSEQVDQLAKILRAEPKKMIGRLAIWFSIVMWPMVFLPSWLTFGQGGGMPPVFRFLLFGAFLAGYVILFPLLVAKPRLQGTLLYCLTQVNDTKLLGPLITYSNKLTERGVNAAGTVSKLLGGPMVKPEQLEQALLTVLRNTKPGDKIDLTVTERGGITTLLFSRSTKVVIALLALMEHIGSSSDLSNIRALEPGSKSGRASLEVREAAARCRTMIEGRLEQQQVPETLLRASQSSTPTKELMRSVAAAPQINEQVLLRTSQADEPLMP